VVLLQSCQTGSGKTLINNRYLKQKHWERPRGFPGVEPETARGEGKQLFTKQSTNTPSAKSASSALYSPAHNLALKRVMVNLRVRINGTNNQGLFLSHKVKTT